MNVIHWVNIQFINLQSLQKGKGGGKMALLGLRITAGIRLRFATPKFGKAELRMSAERCPKFGSAAVKRDVKNERK